MAGNSFGQQFRITTFGESHGPMIGVVIDGCPAGLELDSARDIAPFMQRRRPGQSHMTSQRREADTVNIVSGVFEGMTTGAPITLLIENTDQKSHHYDDYKNVYRPGHGDAVYQAKYGHRDYRGGGRASARETAARVAAGAIAYKYLRLQCGIEIRACVDQIGEIVAEDYSWQQIADNPFYFADPNKVDDLTTYFQQLRKDGDSIGARIYVEALNVPVGLGEPVFDKLDADIAKAMMSINAAKGISIGDGFDVVNMRGSEQRDALLPSGYETNHSGGILAGISTGQTIAAQVAFKPTSSIPQPISSVDVDNQPCCVKVTGRHDPCVGIRAVVIVEMMLALVLMDKLLTSNHL